MRRATGDDFTQNYDPDGPTGPSPVRGVTHYYIRANRLWNGQTISVTSAGLTCGITNGAPATAPAVPFVRLQQVSSCGGGTVGAPVTFTFSGGNFTGNQQCTSSAAANADMLDVHLNRCDDPNTSLQLTAVQTSLQRELALSGTGVTGYTETNDGTYFTVTSPTPAGIPAQGNTPIAGSLQRLKQRFDVMWASDQTPGTLQLPTDTILVPAPASRYDIDAISTHNNPKEPTLIIFVTDGDDTCAIESGATNNNALATAYQAQRLYTPIVGPPVLANGQYAPGTDTASSVTTYVIGFGSGGSVNRLNWIAWGGSGMTRPTTTQNHFSRVPTDTVTRWVDAPASAAAAGCVTCRDALMAPDPDTLKAVLFSIINQGAKQGAFSAQQSVGESVFEFVDEVTPPAGQDALDPRNADNRYQGVVPVRFESNFTLPGFEGHLRAITADNAGTSAVVRWEAGQKLFSKITAGMSACSASAQCTFPQLHAGATDLNIDSSSAAIKRRVYTTVRNGVFTATVDNLTTSTWVRTQGTSGDRVAVWPPSTNSSGVAPAGLTPGLLDGPMGLSTMTLTQLQSTPHFACLGTPLPAACSSSALAQSRREVREMILAFLVGARVDRDNFGNPLRSSTGDILYKARTWPLAESTLASPAVITPPLLDSPGFAQAEYTMFADGVKRSSGTLANAIDAGFGLRNPDKDDNSTIPIGNTTHGVDPRTTQKPLMSVVYLGSNDMLHAFRAGPNCAAGGAIDPSAVRPPSPPPAPPPTGCDELGGEELWGFVPYDQLVKLKELVLPVNRDPHTYVVASSLRFADVFVPGTFSKSIDGATFAGTGVWRKVLYFGRGAGGRSLTALDVTAPGPFTRKSLDTNGPIVLWNRGNPDTNDGTAGGTRNNTTADFNAYAKMGQTWSVPAIAWVDRAFNITPRAGEFDFVAYVGSGFSDTCAVPPAICDQGKTFYALDALTGDVIANASVGNRGGITNYQNAIVAPPAAFSADTTSFANARAGGHPSRGKITRVYFGDLHGFAWKVVSSSPGTLIQFADLVSDPTRPQPVTTGAGLINIPTTGSAVPRPHVYLESGNFKLGDPPVPNNRFRMFGLVDENPSDTSTTPPGSGGIPVAPLPGFPIEFDPVGQDPRIPFFRGTAQPTTVFERSSPTDGIGRVFFTGTRFNPPGTPEAPPPFPCRSSFDSVVFVVGAETGQAAFDLSAVGGGTSDQFLVFKDSRLLGVQLAPDVRTSATGTNATRVVLDEGLVKTDASGNPIIKTPPPKGIQPINVARVSTEAAFSASTICQ